MTTSNTVEEKVLRRIPWEIFIVSLLFALACLVIFDILSAVLVLGGGAFSAVSFIWLKKSITSFLMREKKKALSSAILLYSLRILLILAIFFIIILFFSRRIIAFAAGFSVILPVFLVEAVVALSKMKQ